MRLQVYLSHNGVCSRRRALILIQAGHVEVNNKEITEPSYLIDPKKDQVSVDGDRIKTATYDYIVLNKPKGFTTTKADRHATRTVYDLLPVQYRHLASVGRLDRDSEGLLLLTNDGEVNYHLTHPKFQTIKKYFVQINGRLEFIHKSKLEAGIFLDGKRTAPAKINLSRKTKDFTTLYMIIHEGKYRQIRRMFAKMKYKVAYLQRVQHGPLLLSSLKLGRWRQLVRDEKKQLLRYCQDK
ncbi:MAG: rRNA pseudouridine synthase [Candidatus Omnitrophica bacterium]|nr:rRNA pseudouridine synthase [Candidatus Omnitrophota bacterium]